MSSETPLTDFHLESPNERTVPIDFARQLERELNQWQAVAGALAEAMRQDPHVAGYRSFDCGCRACKALAAYEALNKE